MQSSWFLEYIQVGSVTAGGQQLPDKTVREILSVQSENELQAMISARMRWREIIAFVPSAEHPARHSPKIVMEIPLR